MNDQNKLKETAIVLKLALDKYSGEDSLVADLRKSLIPFIESAISGTMEIAISWKQLPGDYSFEYTDLRRYRDLESAYSRFKIEATGGEPEALKIFRARHQLDE